MKNEARARTEAVAGGPAPEGTVHLGPLAEFIGFHLRLAQNASFHAFARRVGINLKPGRFALLSLIGENPGLTPTGLSTASGRDKSTITPALRDLVARGLVTRQPAPSDGRSCVLTLTPAGEALLREVMVHAAAHDCELDRIIGEEKPQLLRMLRKIVEELGYPKAGSIRS
jgi:DNA-binding MarR family transcriptional regulator